jgi:hypothetical protein
MAERSIITRRRVLQSGAAAGILLSVPALPLPAVAQRRELELISDPLDLAGSRHTSDPVPQHHGELTTASARHLALPALAVGEFRMAAVSWRGGPTGGASMRIHRPGVGWSPWHVLHVDVSEAPDDVDPEERFSAPLWVDQADAVEIVLPDGVSDPALHRLTETDRAVALLGHDAAGAQSTGGTSVGPGAPNVRMRTAWGARAFRGSPAYSSDIKMSIVHHSATANGYSAAEVPSIIAGIQRFHQDGRGWNDIAYNFVVDRFGQLWEGRAGGVDRPVIGGHTFGANTSTIGICYLGTATSAAAIPAAALNSITHLLRWKFNQVHAVAPNRTTRYTPVTSNSASRHPAGVAATLNTVVGHSTMSRTECPGQALGRLEAAVLNPLTRMGSVSGVDPAPGGGFWLTTGDGQAFPRAGAGYFGSMFGLPLNHPMIALAPTASGRGYWMLAADGGIFSFGDARFHGSTGDLKLNRPIVGMATTATSRGYWLVASDGGIFSFGDARFYGSAGAFSLNAPIVGMARSPRGAGYWLFATDGGIFAFGDAPFLGSAGGERLPSPAVAVGAHPDGTGYWLALANGTVRAYNAPAYGSATVTANDPVVGIAVTATGRGYWLGTRSGAVHRFGDAS